MIKEGVLICPLHFWRYRLPEGVYLAGEGSLALYPVEVIDGKVFVEVPEPQPQRSLREIMLEHAAQWSRS